MTAPKGPRLYRFVCPGCNAIQRQPGSSTVVAHRCPMKKLAWVNFKRVD